LQAAVLEDGRTCDRLDATADTGAPAVRYFRIDLLMKEYDRMLKNTQ